MQAIPAPRLAQPGQPDLVARGKALFNDAAVGCASCHSGARLTNNATVDVGTGAPFQVPSLRGLTTRGPWMHDGCAKTLADRFDPLCGGDRHGNLTKLTAEDTVALVKYLETL
jgi:cytochrome c peroxidase